MLAIVLLGISFHGASLASLTDDKMAEGALVFIAVFSVIERSILQLESAHDVCRRDYAKSGLCLLS